MSGSSEGKQRLRPQERPGRKEGLSQQAYEPIPPGGTYDPYISPEARVPEMSLKAVLAGIVFGILFGFANAYLGLRVGLTISTSIPVAVLTVAGFRALSKMGTESSLLEANLSQTVGSASSSVASGVIFTLPALFLWGLSPSLLQMTLLAMCGGLLGVLFMIPLRKFLIAREHGNLPYPEGTACAEVLVASEIGRGRARNVLHGLAFGAFFKLVFGWIKVLPGSFHLKVPFLKKGELGLEISAALFGVGYILGPRIGAVMVGGGLLSWLIIIPIIAVWGEGRVDPLYPETVKTITEMSPSLIWTRYVRYIGAGAVATGGLITLFRSIPTMIESFRVGSEELKARMGGRVEEGPRTSRDLPLKVTGFGALLLVGVMTFVPQVFDQLDAAWQRGIAGLLVAISAFFFVTVSSRIVGLVGVTSNPTSGMTIATLLATSAVFLALGWTGLSGKAAALTIGCVVAIAASIAGDTSQDLKTGFLLGATPRRQQLGELIGVLTSATFVCLALIILGGEGGQNFGTADLAAPQATLMKLVIDGVLEQSLPWTLVLIGVGIAIVAELARIPSLPFAVGVYLPVSTMLPLFLGSLLRWKAERGEDGAGRRERGVLFGSGLVGGEGLLGVVIAIVASVVVSMTGRPPTGIGADWAGAAGQYLSLVVFGVLAMTFWRYCKRE